MKEIKHQFYTYRNGAVADTLRRYGLPHKVIFGLEIPRIAEISRMFTPSAELAERLWADRDVRESRLLATYLYPHTELTLSDCHRLASDARSQEEADMLAFRIFKRLPYAHELLQGLESDEDENSLRCAASLRNHLS